MRPGDGRNHQQRADDGASLVHDRVQTESPSVPNFLRGPGEQYISRRSTQRLAGTFDDNQDRRGLPVLRECERGHGNHVHRVTEKGDGPIGPGAIGEASREEAQAGAQHFANAGNDGNLKCRGAEIPEVRADDAMRALIGHVGEQAYDAKTDDEAQSGTSFVRVVIVRNRLVPQAAMVTCALSRHEAHHRQTADAGTG